jgi:hypothetical protein
LTVFIEWEKWGRPDSNQRPPAPEALKESMRIETNGFDAYLNKVLTNSKDISYLLAIAKKYKHVLETSNASELQTMSADKKRQSMRALAHLSKYNGCYEHWQKIIKNNGIKWRKANNDDFSFFEQESITEMIDAIKNTMKILSTEYANTFLVATMLGLRADETCNAIQLVPHFQLRPTSLLSNRNCHYICD